MSNHFRLRPEVGTLRGLVARLPGSVVLWALADHALLSVSNLTTFILVARVLGPSDFGVFVLLYSALQLLGGVQSALITQPHNMIGPSLDPGNYRPYKSAAAVAQLFLALLGASAALLVAAAAALARPDLALNIALLAPATLSGQIQEFARRVLYSEERIRAAVANDAVSYGLQACAVAGLSLLGNLDVTAALLAITVTSAAGAIIGWFQTNPGRDFRQFRSVLADNWRLGRWLLGGTVASWLSTDLYLYLLATATNTLVVGTFRAMELLLRPLNVALVAMDGILLVRLSRLRSQSGDSRLRQAVPRLYTRVGPWAALYVGAVILLSEPLLRFLVGDGYDPNPLVVPTLGAAYLLRFVGQISSIALRAMRNTRPLFQGSLYGAAIATTVGPILVYTLQAEGAALGLLLTAAVVLWVRARAYESSAVTDHTHAKR